MAELIERLNAALAGRYRILSVIGKGGAAVVYRAEDLRHERRVALKVLRPDLAAVLGADRFLREIKIAAQLSHPHILPVHDSGEADGFLYYVMPVVEGESLRQRIAREHALPVVDTVRILHDLLDALHHAHQRGIVHRDIKPDNVMLSGRHALVADFGVAKGLSVATKTGDIDTLGVALGTPTYMAPEQAAADPNIDHRADIYSVGALAYELLTGRAPFVGDSPQAILAAQVTATPEPITDHRVGLPPELAELIMRCLAKDPRERCQSADEMLRQLDEVITPSEGLEPVSPTLAVEPSRRRRVRSLVAGVAVLAVPILFAVGLLVREQPAVAPSNRPVLVVLPFENLGPGEDEFFANGITDAITARLVTSGDIGVISRTSAMQFRGSGKTVQEIAAELGADYVLEGTIQRERPSDPTSRVRITPQLVRASDDQNVWADSYEGTMTEVFRVQSEIAERVARALNLTILEPEGGQLAGGTRDVEAYEAYLRGHDYLEGNRGSGDANARRIAIDLFEEAIALDSSFAQAYAELSLAHLWLFHHFVDRSVERLAQAKASADRALTLDPQLTAGHMALGHYYYWGVEPDPDRALQEFELVARQEPNNAYALTLLGTLQAARGVWDEALKHKAAAADLDPSEPEWALSAGDFHLMARRYTDAQRYVDRALVLAPDWAQAYRSKMSLYLRWQGDTQAAKAIVTEMEGKVTEGEVALALIDVAPMLVTEGGYDRLFEQLTPASISGPLPFDYYHVKAEFYGLRGRATEARAYYDSLLAALESLPGERGGDPTIELFYARAYAGLGRRGDAIRRARDLESLIPALTDPLQAEAVRRSLVGVYAMVGEYDAALDHLEELLRVPSLISVAYLRIGYFPGLLRRHPRFQQLLDRAPQPPLAS